MNQERLERKAEKIDYKLEKSKLKGWIDKQSKEGMLTHEQAKNLSLKEEDLKKTKEWLNANEEKFGTLGVMKKNNVNPKIQEFVSNMDPVEKMREIQNLRTVMMMLFFAFDKIANSDDRNVVLISTLKNTFQKSTNPADYSKLLDPVYSLYPLEREFSAEIVRNSFKEGAIDAKLQYSLLQSLENFSRNENPNKLTTEISSSIEKARRTKVENNEKERAEIQLEAELKETNAKEAEALKTLGDLKPFISEKAYQNISNMSLEKGTSYMKAVQYALDFINEAEKSGLFDPKRLATMKQNLKGSETPDRFWAYFGKEVFPVLLNKAISEGKITEEEEKVLLDVANGFGNSWAAMQQLNKKIADKSTK
ncbi:MAG: hypothetical protein WC897_02035 [Candidatus Gracilibacteria bacterium]